MKSRPVLIRLVVMVTLIAIIVAAVRRIRALLDPPPSAPPVPSPTPTPSAAPAPAGQADPTPVEPDAAWVEPETDGSCPEGYPIKAKAGSGIFHAPGGASYERTAADRCYRSPAAAEADGMRAAKR